MNGDNVFRQKFTRINGLSAIRRLPRLGKIRLGIKKTSEKTGKEYPCETKHFVCPTEVMHVCGNEPTELKISFPINDPEVIFPQCYKWYGSSKGLKCRGDGINALRLNDETNEMEERTCPCELLENGKCKQRASLVFNLLDVGIGGVYQIDLSSYHSIVDINSGIDYARALLNDHIAFVPFLLKRVPKETHNDGKKQIHYTLQLELNLTAKQLQKYQEGQRLFNGQDRQYEIEAPKPEDDINPAYDLKQDEAVIEEETEEEEKARIEKREKRQTELQEEAEKENKRINEQQAKLKQEIAEGKHMIKTPEEVKKILAAKRAKIAELDKIALSYQINDWNEIIDVGVRHNIFFDGIMTGQAKTYICNHQEAYDALLEAIKTDQQITDEDIPNSEGKLELREGATGLLDDDEEIAEEDIPGGSINNAIPFRGKAKAN